METAINLANRHNLSRQALFRTVGSPNLSPLHSCRMQEGGINSQTLIDK